MNDQRPIGIEVRSPDRSYLARNNVPATLGLLIFVVGIVYAWPSIGSLERPYTAVYIIGSSLLLALIVGFSLKVAAQWEKTVVLRLGRFKKLKGPGVFLIFPVVDTVPYWIDTRVITTPFRAEKTLTKDTVPVDVDAVLFWKVINAEKAALNVADYISAIGWAAQTALRDVIGKTLLADMLEGRAKIGSELQKLIDERTEQWGIQVTSVEIRDVIIPQGLEDAMSMQAQAERERQARVILGDSERQIANKFEEAAKSYSSNPTAFHLRAMNMLYDGLKQNSTIVLVPSSAVDSMQLGGLMGAATLTEAMMANEREKREGREELKIKAS